MLQTEFIQAKPALCSLRAVLRALLKIYLPLDEPRALFGARGIVRFRDCGQNTLMVRRLDA